MKATGLIPLIALLSACAQVRDPTGGPKDSMPPALVRSEPASGTIRFTGTEITLTFDERIKLDRVRNNLLISPPLEELPEVRQVGADRITIDLDAPLAPNTTYVFNFGEAVVDLSEGNPARDLVVVLSTGDHIDSLSLSGMVQHAFFEKPEQGVGVMLFAEGDTGAFKAARPLYFARTREDGSYHLPYLAEGRYLIRALRDQNGNYRYDLPNEDIALLSTPVEVFPGDTMPLPPLELFRELGPNQQVLAYRVLPDRALELVFGRPADSLRLESLGSGASPSWIIDLSIGRDTAVAWPNDTTLLNGVRFVLFEGATIVDTLIYRVPGPMPFQLEARALRPEARGVPIRVSRPLGRVDPDRFAMEGDTSRNIALDLDSVDHRLVWLSVTGPDGAGGKVRLLPKALRDIYGGWNDSLTVDLSGPDPKTLGTVTVELAWEPEAPVVVLLLDSQGQVIRRAWLPLGVRRCVWEALAPGPYAVRMALDRNGNKRWDPGSLRQNRLPEPVFTYPGPVQVRAAWEIGLDWKLEGP